MIGVSNITNRTDPNSLKSRVFVGNLNTVQMSKTELESVFVKYGAIVGISVHKGYAFIQYANETSARAAVIGEDSKSYYNMTLDVTIASEPKNRKRGRSNLSSTIPACTGLSELALQAQALNTITGNPVLSLQQLGLEGIMGQPNLLNFAAAANSVLNATPFNGLNVPTVPSATNLRSKHTRSSNTVSSSPSVAPISLAAKRTRLEGMSSSTGGASNSASSLPAGARGQNLVSLVSATDIPVGSANRSAQVRQVTSPNKGPVRHQNQTNDQSNNNASSVRSRVTVPPNTRQNSSVPATSRSSSVTSVSSAQKSKPEDNKNTGIIPNRTQAVNHSSKSDNLPPIHHTSRTTECSSIGSNSPGLSSQLVAEDILICGRCRRLFEQVDELISHKMAGCSLDKETGATCRCRAEPSSLECVYCGANFCSAWDLMHHCHKDHGLTIYALPSPPTSPNPSFDSISSNSSNLSHRFSENSNLITNELSNLNCRSHRDKKSDRSMSGVSVVDQSNVSSEHAICSTNALNNRMDNHENSDWDTEEQEHDRSDTPTLESVHEEEEVVEEVEVQEQDDDDEDDDDDIDNNNNNAQSNNSKIIEIHLNNTMDIRQENDTCNLTESPSMIEISEQEISENNHKNKLKLMLKTESPPCPRRSRGGEYGRHETVEDEDDYGDEDLESDNIKN